MSEWWTYTLSDFLLFSPHTYYRLFELYNLDIWPAQIASLALGVAVLALLRYGGAWQSRLVMAILAGCWLFVAWAFHVERYATINWAATYFAAGFAIEGLLLIWTGLIRGRIRSRLDKHAINRAGLGIFLFALVVQPLIGPLVGRPWTQVEIFGVAPDPTAVATLGLLLTADRVPWVLLVVPILWCAISGATLWTMQSPDALVLPLVALLVLVLAIWKTLSRRPPTAVAAK
jgi:Family of unknown function (DUF6064)